MSFRRLIFRPPIPSLRLFNMSDVVALLLVGVLIYLGIRLAFNTPAVVRGPDISLAPFHDHSPRAGLTATFL